MEGNTWMSGRAGLVARSRRYLAAVVTGGIAVGGGLTVAAAHVATTASAGGSHSTGNNRATRSARTRTPRVNPAPRSTSPVRAVRHHASRPAPQPAASTHAS